MEISGVDVYSLMLGLAILAAGAALCMSLAEWLPSLRANPLWLRASGVRRAAGILSVVALLLVASAGVFHLINGHPPGSALALAPGDFFREHPALLTAAALAAGALVLLRVTKPVADPRETRRSA